MFKENILQVYFLHLNYYQDFLEKIKLVKIALIVELTYHTSGRE